MATTPRSRIQLVLRIRHENGSYRHVDLCSVNMVHDPAIRGILTSFRDVTSSVQTDRRLQKNRERLRQVVRSAAARTAELQKQREELEGFAFSASHDLRAPLRAVQGYAQALLEDCERSLDENGREHLGHIIDASQRMDRLLSDLLTYSRVGRQEMHVGRVALGTAIDDACESLAGEISAARAIIRVREPLPDVFAHHSTLVRTFANLISNALKFVAPGSVPELQIYAEQRETEQHETMVRVCFSDNGIGVPADQQDRIFQLFERLHGEERYPGTGVGLAIVKRASARLGGNCGVTSQIGKGSCFWIELPHSPASVASE